MRRRKRAVVVVAILVCTAMRLDHAIAAIYYVDSGHALASDSNPGTEGLPWLTLQHAADVVTAGDKVMVKAGAYTDVLFSTSGTLDAQIIFQGLSTSTAVIHGVVEFMGGVAHVHVSNFTVRDYQTWGVFLRGNNHHIVMDGLHIAGGGAGIHLTYGYQAEDPLEGPVSDITIQNSLIESCTYTGIDCTPGPCDGLLFRNLEVRDMGVEISWGADGIAVERGEDILVQDCFVHDNAGDGIDLNSRDFDGHVEGVVVRRNRVVRNHSNGIKMWAGGRMENNLIWGQGNTPVMLGAFPGAFEIINNTVAYNMWDDEFAVRNYALLAAYPNDETHVSPQVDLTLVNNIFAFNCHDDLGGPTGLYLGQGVTLVSESHNLYWSREDGEIQADFFSPGRWFSRQDIADGTWAQASGQGLEDVVQDPDFVAGWPGADLHLLETSPAVDGGLSISDPTSDIEGQTRPSGAEYDIGAFEFQYVWPVCEISITAPAGGEIWCSDEPHRLEWTSQQTSGSLRIDYSDDGGSSWHTVATTTPDDGQYNWVMPHVNSEVCLVRVCDVSKPDCCGESRGGFRICDCEDFRVTGPIFLRSRVGCDVEQIVRASGGCPPYIWSALSGNFPAGIGLDTLTGRIHGAPREVGDHCFIIQARDVVDHAATALCTLAVDDYAPIKGDANADCRIDILDVVMAVNFILEIDQPTIEEHWRADCNGPAGRCDGDGVIDIMDALKMVQIILTSGACP